MSQSVPAIILAGGRNKPEMAAATGEDLRAVTPLGGRPMLEYILESMDAAESVGEIVVVGDIPGLDGVHQVRDHGGFVENVYAGLSAVSGERALISTSDIPFVTAESVDSFTKLAGAENADVVYPIVRVEDCYARFPGMERTTVRLKEGEFTGGNMMLVHHEFMEKQRNRIARAYQLRKSPLRLALMVGVGTTLRLAASIATRRPLLSIHDLESSISRAIGGKARAVMTKYAELATDVDRESDLAAAENALRTRLEP